MQVEMRWKLNSSVYKRMSSKELTNGLNQDIENSVKSALLQENGNPPWKLSLPHICVATLVSFLFGYHVSVVNEPLESISLDLGFAGNTLAEGLVVSTCLGGAFVGCLFSGSIADGIGRRRSFQLSALPMIIGAALRFPFTWPHLIDIPAITRLKHKKEKFIISNKNSGVLGGLYQYNTSASSNRLEGMLLGRFLVGTGMGLGPPIASLYVTEISPSYVRGTYGSFIQIATCLGIIVALFIGIPVKNVTGWWRVCFWVATAPAALLAICMEFCAESPHWLYKRGRIGEAEAEFERLLGATHVKAAMAELTRSDRGDDGDSVKYSELLYGRHFKVVFIGTMLFALQQLSGINAVFYFSSTVFKSAGVPSNLANMCVGFSNLSGSVVAMLLMDKLGRRYLLLGSFIGMAVAMGVQAGAASLHNLISGTVPLSVGGMLLFVLSFSLGAGPVPGLLLPEIFPNKIRAKAMALCMSVHWVVNFFVGLLFLRLLEQLGAQLLYSIFATFCVIAAIFVRKNVVETKGKSLQEIEVALLQS